MYVILRIAFGLVGAVGEGGLAAKVDVSAKERVSEYEFLRRQLVENVVVDCEIALLVIVARFGVVGQFCGGVLNKVSVEVHRKTAQFAVVIEVEVVFVIVGKGLADGSCEVVVSLVVAERVDVIVLAVVAVEDSPVCEFCAHKVVVVYLIIDADVSREIVVVVVTVALVVSFPTVVGIVEGVNLLNATEFGVVVIADSAKQVKTFFAVVEVEFFLQSPRTILKSLIEIRFCGETETFAHRFEGRDAYHGVYIGGVTCTG